MTGTVTPAESVPSAEATEKAEPAFKRMSVPEHRLDPGPASGK